MEWPRNKSYSVYMRFYHGDGCHPFSRVEIMTFKITAEINGAVNSDQKNVSCSFLDESIIFELIETENVDYLYAWL